MPLPLVEVVVNIGTAASLNKGDFMLVVIDATEDLHGII